MLDIYGLSTVTELIDKQSNQGTSCLALAEAIKEGRAPSDHGDARYWAERALQLGLLLDTLLEFLHLVQKSEKVIYNRYVYCV